jgi:hypothetical protein
MADAKIKTPVKLQTGQNRYFRRYFKRRPKDDEETL